MRRCFDLARLGAGQVAPNPMVGAVLVYGERIIGEGFHAAYGQAHAEVNAVASVKDQDRHLIRQATLFVSLEPCCIFGKTPPCTDLIRREGIPKVVISCLDATPSVAGNGVSILREHGVEVVVGILEEEGKQLVRFRNLPMQTQRPFTILKIARSADHFIGRQGDSVWITDGFSRRLSHKWRAEVSAILVGSSTAIQDNPRLDARYYPGKNPLRIVVDRRGRVSGDLHLLSDPEPCWIFTENPDRFTNLPREKRVYSIAGQEDYWPFLFEQLLDAGCNSLLVEGGAAIQSDLLHKGYYDEVRILTGPENLGPKGIPMASPIPDFLGPEEQLLQDRLIVIPRP
jgi:diaminohydroxyphosphoribosylaminopyrimidine deaminase/5-amino-6-(5-phosphoribosylamino)uracil reductase